MPQGDEGQVNVLSLCVCHNCRLMPINAHNKCCRQRKCVTNSSGFGNLVIDCDALNIHTIDFFQITHQQVIERLHIGNASYKSMGI